MALANFFDKTALAAAEVLSGFDYKHFRDRLEALSIGITFDAAGARSPEGRITLDLVANLLARIYPRLRITPLDEDANAYVGPLRDLVTSINPAIDLELGPGHVHCGVAIGSRGTSWENVVYAGSSGWLCSISPVQPLESGNTNNPFGAAAAACFAAANVFRSVFRTQLFEGGLDQGFTLSTFNFELNPRSPHNPAIAAADIGEIHLVGVGAVGSACVWALQRTRSLSGALHLIDPEMVDLTNLQRYVTLTQGDANVAKVDVAKKGFTDTSLAVVGHVCSWAEYLFKRGNLRLPVVGVSVDTARARCEVQASLPRWIVNAWTQPLDLGISRHNFLSDYACLMCLYLPDATSPNEDQVIAQAIGVPDELMRVRELLARNLPVDEDFLQKIAAAKGIPIDPLRPFLNRSLREFYSQAVCGGVLLTLSPESGRGEPVPMAFQSVLAGVLMAGEIIGHTCNLKTTPPPVTTRLNMLQPITKHISFNEKKTLNDRCICRDQDYITMYKTKYNIGLSPGE